MKLNRLFSFTLFRRSPLLFFCLALLLMAGGGCRDRSSSGRPPDGKIYPVQTAAAQVEELPELLEMKGNFTPSDKLEVKAETDGKVISVQVSEGQMVAFQEPLASINPETLKLLLDKLQADLKEQETRIGFHLPARYSGNPNPLPPSPPPLNPTDAENPDQNPFLQLQKSANQALTQNLNNANRDATNNNEPKGNEPKSLDSVGDEAPPNNNGENNDQPKTELPAPVVEAALERIKAEIALTEKKIQSADLVAGISGMVTRKNITDGSVVTAGETLFQIVRIDPILFSTYLPHDSISKIQKGQKFDLIADDLPEQLLSGEVAFIAPEPDAQNKNYEVRFSLSNNSFKLKSGMAGKIFIPLPKVEKTLTVPQSALIEREGKTYFYVLKGETAEQREVQAKKIGGGKLEVLKGIHEGDEVVTQGYQTYWEEKVWVQR